MVVGRYLGALALIFVIGGCSRVTTEAELEVIKTMTMNMQTTCFGRYLIDLPDSFRWGVYPEAEFYYGLGAGFKVASVQIVDVHTNEDRFLSRVLARTNAIAAEKNLNSEGSMLLERRDLDENRVMIKRYRSTETDRSKTYEIHQRLGPVHILLKSDSYPDDKKSAEQILLQLSSQVSLMETDGGQVGPGFCLGPVLVNADSDHEVLINQSALDRKRPDVRFELYMSAVTQDDDEKLLDQIEREKGAFDSAPKMLRKARIKVGAMEADEALMRFEEDGLIMHSFIARSYRETPTLATPTVELRLGTGGEISEPGTTDLLKFGDDGALPGRSSPPRAVSSSLTDNEAIGVWDTIVTSVRLRPGSVPAGQ